MGSFGFASEEITAVFEKVLNESNLSSGQMEKFKLYLLNSLGRFGGNETIQSTLAGDVQEYEHVLPDYTTYIYFCAAIPAAFFCYGSRYVKDKPLRHQLLVNIGLILMYNVILLTVHDLITSNLTAFGAANIVVYLVCTHCFVVDLHVTVTKMQ